MAEFMTPPILVLETMEDVRKFIEDPKPLKERYPKHPDAYGIKSLWLISLIDELAVGVREKEAKQDAETARKNAERKDGVTVTLIRLGGDGLVGNADVAMLAEKRLGYPPKKHEEYQHGDLATLVYNAQNYRHSDQLIADGFVPITQELLDETGVGGEIVTAGDRTFRLREVSGKLYAMLPRKRNQALSINGQPVKVVKQGKKAKV